MRSAGAHAPSMSASQRRCSSKHGGEQHMDKLHADWIEFLRLLTAHRVRFLVVGGHAVAAHGRPRLTADLDIFLAATRPNADRVVRATEAFGFSGLVSEVLLKPDTVVFLGREPFRIDLLTSIDGVGFEAAWKRRMRGRLGGRPVAFLGLSDLLANKRAAGRPKDVADVALLQATRVRPGRAPADRATADRARRPPTRSGR